MLRRVILILLIAFAAAILSVHLAASRQGSVVGMLFTNPDGSPCERDCLFGIRPGITTHEEAIALLNRHPLLENVDGASSAISSSLNLTRKGKGIFQGTWIKLNITT